MTKFFKHLRIYIFRGLLAIIPLLLTFIAITLLYKLIDKKVMSFLDQFIHVRQIPGMGILLVLLSLYLIGLIVSNVVGKQLLYSIGQVTEHIPIIKIIYQLGKQLSESFSTASGKQAFQKALLVKGINDQGWVIGLLAGTVKDNTTGEEFLRVFIPATHNPLLGCIILVKSDQTRDPGWTVEETFKAMVSIGIVFPSEIKK
ncbi:MAG: DUF502 domain-containing protein [Candidatus Omnitrophica bacterium]|nr:DUF502 domain-containing protein [Candidatus Omnitrophota bacterium]